MLRSVARIGRAIGTRTAATYADRMRNLSDVNLDDFDPKCHDSTSLVLNRYVEADAAERDTMEDLHNARPAGRNHPKSKRGNTARRLAYE